MTGRIELKKEMVHSILIKHFTEQGYHISSIGEKEDGTLLFYFDRMPAFASTTPTPSQESLRQGP